MAERNMAHLMAGDSDWSVRVDRLDDGTIALGFESGFRTLGRVQIDGERAARAGALLAHAESMLIQAVPTGRAVVTVRTCRLLAEMVAVAGDPRLTYTEALGRLLEVRGQYIAEGYAEIQEQEVER